MKMILREHENGRILPCVYGNECIPDIIKGSISISFDSHGIIIVDCSLIIQSKDLPSELVDKFRKQCLIDVRKARRDKFNRPFVKVWNYIRFRLYLLGLYRYPFTS